MRQSVRAGMTGWTSALGGALPGQWSAGLWDDSPFSYDETRHHSQWIPFAVKKEALIYHSPGRRRVRVSDPGGSSGLSGTFTAAGGTPNLLEAVAAVLGRQTVILWKN